MPYSVMIWLVDPGTGGGVEPKEVFDGAGERPRPPGAATGFTAPPPATCLSFGLFENEIDLEEALTVIGESLRRNAPLRVSHGERSFLVPAHRVHYVVCDQVERPKDRGASRNA